MNGHPFNLKLFWWDDLSPMIPGLCQLMSVTRLFFLAAEAELQETGNSCWMGLDKRMFGTLVMWRHRGHVWLIFVFFFFFKRTWDGQTLDSIWLGWLCSWNSSVLGFWLTMCCTKWWTDFEQYFESGLTCFNHPQKLVFKFFRMKSILYKSGLVFCPWKSHVSHQFFRCLDKLSDKWSPPWHNFDLGFPLEAGLLPGTAPCGPLCGGPELQPGRVTVEKNQEGWDKSSYQYLMK